MALLAKYGEHAFGNETPDYVVYDHANAQTLHKILAIVGIVFIPAILLSNSLVFWSTILFSQFHTPLNVMIFSLSIANLCMGCVCIPVFSVTFIAVKAYVIHSSNFHCLLWFASSWIALGGALVSLLMISLERYLAIVWPDKYKSYASVTSAIVVVLLCWVYILILALFPIMNYSEYREKSIFAKRCNYFSVIPKYYSVIWTVLTIYLPFVIPVILHILTGSKLYSQIRKYNREFEQIGKDNGRLIESDVSTVVMTFALVLIYLLLWLPYLIILSFDYIESFHELRFQNLQDTSQIFYFSSAMVPAPVFAVVRGDYKAVYFLMLRTPPWKWKQAIRKLDTRKRSRQSRFASSVNFIRPSMLHSNSAPTDEDFIIQDLRPKQPPERPIGHFSVSSLHPGETTIC